MVNDTAGYGYDPTTVEDIPEGTPSFVETLPASFTVTSSYLPPVGQQGTAAHPGAPGSCAAWASTYGLATFTAAKNGSIDPSQPSGQASPAYIYIQALLNQPNVQAGTCSDSAFTFYFQTLNKGGTPTMETAPYVADCTELWNKYGTTTPNFDTAFEIGNVASLDVKDSLTQLKNKLASNCPLAYATHLYTDWGSYQGDPSPYVGNGTLKTGANGQPVGHCMLIIGYDDTIGESGAVLIQNSEGNDWGADGYVQMAYSTFQTLASGKAFYVEN